MANPSTIFLTGSSGFVGSSLIRRLNGSGDCRVVPIARREVNLDVEPARPAVVVHAAWPPGDTASWAPFLDWSLRLRESAAESGAWFVGLGSGVEVHAKHPALADPYRSYAMRKLELREALGDVDDRFTWIRLHFLFGTGERPSRLVPAAIRASLTGEAFACGSLARRRRWLHVDDQASYLADFLKAPQPGQWDIAGRCDVSFRDLLSLIERATGHNLRLRESEEPTADSALPVIAAERMATVVPADAGNPGSLFRRLREYASQLTEESTKS